MSHSTQAGFSCPPPFCLGVSEFPKRTASVNETPSFAEDPSRFREPEAFASPAVGVGHIFFDAICSRLILPALTVLFPPAFPLDPYTAALGVGNSAW